MRLKAANRAMDTLSGDIGPDDYTIVLNNASSFPDDGPFIITIGSENILIESRENNSLSVATEEGELEVDGRGYGDTDAVSHDDGDTVSNRITKDYVNMLWDELDKVDVKTAEKANQEDLEEAEDDIEIIKDGGTLKNNQLKKSNLQAYSETVVTKESVSGEVDVDLSEGNVFHHKVTGGVVYSFINAAESGKATSFTLIVQQPSTAYELDWPEIVKWPEGEVPDAPDDGNIGIYTFFTIDGGNTFYGSLVGLDYEDPSQ